MQQFASRNGFSSAQSINWALLCGNRFYSSCCYSSYLLFSMYLTSSILWTVPYVRTEITGWSRILREAWSELESWGKGLLLFIIFFIAFLILLYIQFSAIKAFLQWDPISNHNIQRRWANEWAKLRWLKTNEIDVKELILQVFQLSNKFTMKNLMLPVL